MGGFQSYDKPHPLSPFYEYCNSIGLFIDSGGTDTYTKWIKTTVGEGDEAKEVDSFEPSTKFADNGRWEQPPKDDKNYGYNNFGIGWDLEVNLSTATIPDITWLDPPPVLPEEKKAG